jgi:precorrin-6Y C5,15-methyltransferase (decarboxylating)
MSEELNPVPVLEPVEAAEPARRKAPARKPRKKAVAESPVVSVELAPAEPAVTEKPKAKRAPRKPKKAAEPVLVDEQTADLFAALPLEVAPEPEPVVTLAVEPATELAEDDDAETPAEAAADGEPAITPPAGPRRKRKRRRGKSERVVNGERQGELTELPLAGLAEAPQLAPLDAPLQALLDAFDAPVEAAALPMAEAEPEPAALLPLTVVSLGLEHPPTLSAEALGALRAARLVLGTADALDRLAGLNLDVPQQLCAADSAHVDVRAVGHAGSVLVVVGDGAGDGPAAELLAELGPAHVRVLPGVGRVQAACAALGLSAEIVSVVDLRRAPLAALRGQLRAHRLLAVPVADAAVPLAVARLLLDSGFGGARVWVCEFPGGALKATAWLASELVELREPIDAHAVLIVATGPSAGVFVELPGLSDAALGDGAVDALPLAVRTLALALLQPAAWETGWAIADGEASLALEWARAVPTARVRAVGVEPSLLGVSMARAGVGDNLSAVASATPQRSREWPAPEAVFVRGGVGLSDWLAAAWERLSPGGRLVATAEDDDARADLLAFAGQVPAEDWQELNLSRGETVAGRLRFAPSAPVRLALWRKPALS